MAKWGVDLTGVKPDEMDDSRADPGWYLATLESELENQENGAEELTFRITGPRFKGQSCMKKINNPGLAETEKAAEGQIKVARLWATRLGLLKKEDAGKPAEIDWSKAVGWKGVIELELHEYVRDDGKTGRSVQFTYLGVYPTDHEKIPVAERVRLGLPLLPGQVAPGEDGTPGIKTPYTPAEKAGKKAAPAAAAKKPAFDPSEI